MVDKLISCFKLTKINHNSIVTSTKYYILILTNRQNAETGSRGAYTENRFRIGKDAVDQLVSISLYVYRISQSSSSKLTKLSKKL